jgi:hypothetical protein
MMKSNRDVYGIIIRVLIRYMIFMIIALRTVNNLTLLKIRITYTDVYVVIPTVTGNGIILTLRPTVTRLS